ncbi:MULTISPECIES: hypothetical protein [unclassified Streptomyces]|uniref:hypothetical protein n=1 Tax=unclassified Streptomyces TaxID=2593676 RepID=UPI00131D99FB|nr:MULTISPECIES: hypothetical protein [unclassified Streptomyces]
MPIVAGPAERAAYAEQLRKEVSESLHPHVAPEFAASMDARDPSRPAPSLPYIGDVPTDGGLVLSSRRPAPLWRAPTKRWCCAPPDTNGSSTRPSARCRRPWCPEPA